MRKMVLAVAFASLMATTGVLAASSNHELPGTPGEKNCIGQSIAYLSQVGVALGAAHPGLGNLVPITVVSSVKEIQEVVRAYCAGA
jgi:hypothetical protein